MKDFENRVDSIMNSKCPFAEMAFNNNQVKIIHGGPKEIIYNIDNWSDEFQVIAVIPKYGWFRWFSWCLKMESQFAKKDMTAIPNGKHKYILIQRLKELVDVSNNLMETSDYYKNHTAEQMESVERRRRLSEEWPRL